MSVVANEGGVKGKQNPGMGKDMLTASMRSSAPLCTHEWSPRVLEHRRTAAGRSSLGSIFFLL